MTKRNSAIHATSRLLLKFIDGEILINLKPVVNPLQDGAALRSFPSIFQKSCRPAQGLCRSFANRHYR